MPISFVVPHLTVTVAAVGTLDPSDQAVVQAHVTCDVATQISAVSVITQGTEARSFRIVAEQCEPGQPTPLFLAGYPTSSSSPLSLGTASISVTVAPYGGYQAGDPAPGPVTATGDADLIDQRALATAITQLLADPANVELRQQMADAIRERAYQDPVFAAAFRALFQAGAGRPPNPT